MRRVALYSYRRRRSVLIGWIVLLIAVFALSQTAGGVFRNELALSDSESADAFDLLEERGFADRAGFSGQIVFEAEQGVDDPAVRGAMEGLFAEVEATVPDVEVVSPYSPAGARQVAEDGQIAYAEVNLADRADAGFREAADDIEAAGRDIDLEALDIAYGGDLFFDEEVPASEAIALLHAVAIIGVGVGIDYALLIVTRYRQVLRDGRDPESSIVLALDTAGRSVLFAGTTVVIAVLGLLLINVPAVRGLAVGIALGVLMTMLGALTMLPAV